MNRKEVKSFLPILQAFADGKEIECREEDKWYKVLEICNKTNPQDYRIKPEPKYRPFKDAEECWTEMQRHQPFGWVKEKERNVRTEINYIHNEGVMFSCGSVLFECMFDIYTFADDTPFGMKLEE